MLLTCVLTWVLCCQKRPQQKPLAMVATGGGVTIKVTSYRAAAAVAAAE